VLEWWSAGVVEWWSGGMCWNGGVLEWWREVHGTKLVTLATLYLTLISTWDRGQAVPCVYD